MSQYLDGHRVLRKNVAMAKPMQQNISQASLGWKPRSPVKQNLPSAHSASPCISHVDDHWLLPLFETMLITYYENPC
jgi:hypothetical protein